MELLFVGDSRTRQLVVALILLLEKVPQFGACLCVACRSEWRGLGWMGGCQNPGVVGRWQQGRLLCAGGGQEEEEAERRAGG